MSITRREFFRSGIGLVSMVAASDALSMTKGNLGARQQKLSNSGVAWDNPYITEGLIHMWDAEFNAGMGKHDSSASKWRDLVGQCDLTITGDYVIGNNYIRQEANCSTALSCDSTASITLPANAHISVVTYNADAVRNQSFRLFSIGTSKFRMRYGNGSYGYYVSDYNGAICATVSIPRKGLIRTDYTLVDNGDGTTTITPYFNGVRKTASTKNTAVVEGKVKFYNYNSERIIDYDFYNAMIYNRPLTTDEMAYNYEVDKERFGL